MLMSFDFMRAIKRPFTDINALSMGMLLLLLPTILFMIIPTIVVVILIVSLIAGFLVRGYKFEAARTALNKKFNMPKWEAWKNLFARGFLGWVIGIIYMIPAMILILIAIGNVLYSIALQFGLNQGLNFGDKISDQLIQSSLLQNTAMIPIFIIGVLLALLAAYLTPIAIMKFVDKYNFKKAFELKSVFRKAFTGKYFIAVLAVIAYSLIIGLLASALSLGFSSINVQFLTAVMGLIISGLSGFMTLITTYTIFGEVYSKLK